MTPTLRSFIAVLAGSFGACLPPPLDCIEIECVEAPVGTTDDPGTPTTGNANDEIQTATGEPEGSSTGETTALPADTSTGEPGAPPTIENFAVEPNFVVVNGVIGVDVETLHADGVRMRIEKEEIDLEAAGPNSFTGHIDAFTGVDNGKHTAILTPWRADLEGVPVEAEYIIQLPAPGKQKFWESADLVGGGSVAALGVLPDGLLVELGTVFEKGEPHCYLRRRQLDGTWFDADFIPVLEGSQCTAIDMKIDPEVGTMHVLVDREGGDGLRWWLGEIASWGKGVKNIGLGAVGDQARAVAQAPGMVAVCGSRPVPGGLDAAVWLHRPNPPVEARTFDLPSILGPQSFAETARDCVFADEVLVVVGEAFGKLSDKVPARDHRFILEHDTLTNFATWTAAGTGPGTQSRALAVDIDDQGRYLVAGLTCNDECEPDGEIRIYLPGGDVAWQAPLGPLNTDVAGPHDIAWSPAGHVIIAVADFDGQAVRFKVQAYKPNKLQPLWTFFPEEKLGFQIPLALAVGQFGEVYAGGIGASNFPAVAYIAG